MNWMTVIPIQLKPNQQKHEEWEIIIEKGCLIESVQLQTKKWLIACSYIVDSALGSHIK